MRSTRTLSQVLGPASPLPNAPSVNGTKRKASAMLQSSYKLTTDQVNKVIHSLALPDREVAAATEHSNDAASATHFGGVQAYAKLAGRDWTYYVKALEVSIGRASEIGDAAPSQVDLDLGPAKVISRLHAKIEYDLQERYWKCSVVGRNGLKVDAKVFKERKVARLSSGQILELGGVQMMFVLPDSPPEVQAAFVPDSLRYELDAPPQEEQSSHASLPHIVPYTPAPITPGPSTGDVDFAGDDARELKPPFSYATLISQAILSSSDRTLTLAQIYNWISSHYSWYRFAKSGWQNSIRHNLSLNKAFVKVPRRAEEPGKGMKWTIQEEFVDEFLNKSRRPSAQNGSRSSSVKRRRKDGAVSPTPPPQEQQSSQYQQQRQKLQGHQFAVSVPVPQQIPLQEAPSHHSHDALHAMPVPRASVTPPLPGQSQDHEREHERDRIAPLMATPPSLPPSAKQQQHQPLSSPAPFWKYMVSNMTTPTGMSHGLILPSPSHRFSPGAALNASFDLNREMGSAPVSRGTPLPRTSSERQSLSHGEILPSPSRLNGKEHSANEDAALPILPDAHANVVAATGMEQLFDLEGVDLRKGFPEISHWSEGREDGAALYSF